MTFESASKAACVAALLLLTACATPDFMNTAPDQSATSPLPAAVPTASAEAASAVASAPVPTSVPAVASTPAVVDAATPAALPAAAESAAPAASATQAEPTPAAAAPASTPVAQPSPVLTNESLVAAPLPPSPASASAPAPGPAPVVLAATLPGAADYQRGTELVQAGQFAAARTLLERAAALNHPAAPHALAGLYAAGQGVPANPARAFELALRSAHLGWPAAMWDVADSYGAGRGVTRDLLASCVWMLRVRDHSGDDKLIEQATQVLPYMERALTLVQMATCHKHGSIWPPEETEAGMADAIQPVPSPAVRERCVTKVGKKGKKTKVCKAVRVSGKGKAGKSAKAGKAGKAAAGKKGKAVKAAGAKKRHATGAGH
jgi:hypothetical protein